jgi:hypothetical protein
MTSESGQQRAGPMHLADSVVAVASNPTHGFSKPTSDRIYLIEGHGVEGDVHGGPCLPCRCAPDDPRMSCSRRRGDALRSGD